VTEVWNSSVEPAKLAEVSVHAREILKVSDPDAVLAVL
jgi:hypothetical protein